MNKTIINFLIILKNASLNNIEHITFTNNSLYFPLLECLYREGIIQSYKIVSNKILIIIRNSNNKFLLKELKFISKPSNDVYFSFKDLCKISDRKIVLILSTNKGLLTLTECKKNKLGGKALFIC